MNKRLNKKMKRDAKLLQNGGGVFGFEFDDVITNGKTISAKGEFENFGSTDLLVEYDKKARLTSIHIGIDYDNFNARVIQGYEFDNYKKFENLITKGKFEDKYARAMNYFGDGTKNALQKGVDLVEEIPGVSNVFVQTYGSDIPNFFVT